MTNPQRDWTQFALLLIDLQRDFWPVEIADHFPKFPARVASLLKLCRAEGIDIIHLRASFQPDMSDWMLKYKLRGRIPCIEGTPGVETLPFALEQPGETVIAKHTFDGFLTPDLLPTLRQRGKRFLLTAGLITSTCVLFTTASAAQSGFLAAVVEDCCADFPIAHHHRLDSYRFVFERTTVNRIPKVHAEWLDSLAKLAAFEPQDQPRP
jgi:ureidoacrylate peracid hydrolase